MKTVSRGVLAQVKKVPRVFFAHENLTTEGDLLPVVAPGYDIGFAVQTASDKIKNKRKSIYIFSNSRNRQLILNIILLP